MIVYKNVITRMTVLRKILLNNVLVSSVYRKHHYCSNVSNNQLSRYSICNVNSKSISLNLLTPLHRKWCSKGLLVSDDDVLKVRLGNDFKKITDLFPLPRSTLHNFTSKTPSKVFEIHYKQNTVSPRGRKKSNQQNDWTCSYVFVWPEKMKFERFWSIMGMFWPRGDLYWQFQEQLKCFFQDSVSLPPLISVLEHLVPDFTSREIPNTALSKRQAAEKSAIQAIHWLYINQRIDSKGEPKYDKKVLADIKSTLKEPIHMTLSDKALELVENIWNNYQDGIKDIYEITFKESKHKVICSPAILNKDSTIDEEDISDAENELHSDENISEIKQHVHPVYGRNIVPPTKLVIERRNRELKRTFQSYHEDLTPLPIDEYSHKIMSTLKDNRVAVIVGAAGCGKSTRVPAAILQHCGPSTNAIVSEPRRVAAIGLAERVASELAEKVGQSVGYQVRLHAAPPKPPCGSILYCTSGVLLRRLQTNPGLEGCSHVIIDEAHERDVNTDVTLLLLKRALTINPELKILIMSATLDTGVFTKYFNECPIIDVPGRTFPVQVSHLEDIEKRFGIKLTNTLKNCQKEDVRPQVYCQEIVEVIKAVDKNEKEGAILVFLPGWSEIKLTKQLLEEHYRQSGIHIILPVHSRLSTSDQTKMFSIPPPGIRKIVLATNVAETSITIPDVVYVVDSGSHKENRVVERTGTASLETVWVSLAGAKQRAGRAGRVQPGHCYRMYTKDKEAELVPHTTPEILRIPLEQTVLDCKSYAPDELARDFLSQLPQPPSVKAITAAVDDLKEIGALTPKEQLTRLGGILSHLTLHPRIGRSLIHSAIVGNIVAMSHVVAHCASNTEVFVNAADRREETRETKRSYSFSSDYWALHSIQEAWDTQTREYGRTAGDTFCNRHSVKGDRLAYIRSLANLHLEQLLKTDMISPTTEPTDLNRFSDIEELMVGVLLSGADSILSTNRHVKTKGKMSTVTSVFTSTGDRAHIGSDSVNHNITKRRTKTNLLVYFGGQHSPERRALVVYKSSIIPPHTAVLFCPGDLRKDIDNTNEDTTVLSLSKHRLKIHVPTSQADHLLKLREMLWKTLEYYIERDVKMLNYDDNTKVSRFKVSLVKIIGRILVEGHKVDVDGKTNELE